MIAREMAEKAQFERGIELFNAGKFFEAHEAWEEIWLGERGGEKAFLQGLIQVAAAFHHQQRGNRKGMESLLAAGLAKLEKLPDTHRGIRLASRRSDAKEWAERLSKGRTAAGLPRIEPARKTAASPGGGRKRKSRRDAGATS